MLKMNGVAEILLDNSMVKQEYKQTRLENQESLDFNYRHTIPWSLQCEHQGISR